MNLFIIFQSSLIIFFPKKYKKFCLHTKEKQADEKDEAEEEETTNDEECQENDTATDEQGR
jgi:hypothetical protein